MLTDTNQWEEPIISQNIINLPCICSMSYCNYSACLVFSVSVGFMWPVTSPHSFLFTRQAEWMKRRKWRLSFFFVRCFYCACVAVFTSRRIYFLKGPKEFTAVRTHTRTRKHTYCKHSHGHGYIYTKYDLRWDPFRSISAGTFACFIICQAKSVSHIKQS